MKASVVLNLIIIVCTAAAVRREILSSGARHVMRYYTTLSNLLSALAALLVIVCRLSGSLPNWVLVLKHVATVAVTVTLLVVVLYLGPVSKNFKGLLVTGSCFFLPLFCPLLAIVTRIFFDRTGGGFGIVLLGMLPVLLYGLLYFQKVVLAPPARRWDDFYCFNKGGKWPVSAAAMVAGGFLISLAFWLI